MGCRLTQCDSSSTVFTNNSSKLLIKIAAANYAHRLCLAASALDIFQHQSLVFPKCFCSLCAVNAMITAEFIWHNEHKMVSCLLFSLKKWHNLCLKSGEPVFETQLRHLRTCTSTCCSAWISSPPFKDPTCLSVWLFWPAAQLSFTSWSERWESGLVLYRLLFFLYSFFFFLFHRVIPDRLWPDSLQAADVRLISASPDTLPDSICLQTCPLKEPCCMTAAGPFEGDVASARLRPIRGWKCSLNTHVHPNPNSSPFPLLRTKAHLFKESNSLALKLRWLMKGLCCRLRNLSVNMHSCLFSFNPQKFDEIIHKSSPNKTQLFNLCNGWQGGSPDRTSVVSPSV